MDVRNIDREYHNLRKRNIVWPLVLILGGLALLLENFNVLPPLSLGRLWPFLLVVWGLDLIWRRYHEGLHKGQQ